jgi:hypothetical protein
MPDTPILDFNYASFHVHYDDDGTLDIDDEFFNTVTDLYTHYDGIDFVRAVYDAAARILNDDTGHDRSDDVWQLRAAYIDAHAARSDDPDDYPDAFYAARDALVAATTGHTMT